MTTNKSNIVVYVQNDISTRFHSNTRAGICSGISEWHSRTDAPATTIYASASVPYDVAVYMDTYGETGWDGQTATSYNGNVIKRATVRINGSYNTAYYSETGLWKAISCHEFGHAIGMAHNTSSAASIMHEYTNEYYNVNGLLKLTVPQAADILCNINISENGSFYDENDFIADKINADAYILSDGSVYAVVLEMVRENYNFARIIITPDSLPGFMHDDIAEDENCEFTEKTVNDCRIVVREYFNSENEAVSLSDNLDIGIDKNGTGIWIICSTDSKDMLDNLVNYLLKAEINLDGKLFCD